MKRLATILLVLPTLLGVRAEGPVIDREQLLKQDLSMLWTGPLPLIDREDTTALEWVERPEPLGYIGKEFRRFSIHIASVTRSATDPLRYALRGKTRTGSNICSFRGELAIDSVVRRPESGEPDAWGGIFGGWRLYGHYTLREDPGQPGAGLFEGTHWLDVAADERGNIYYDTLMIIADGYRNNQWQGNWRSDKTGAAKVCNWGDFRIPESRGLDIGAGEFMPAGEFRQNGWRSFVDCYDADETVRTAARREECCQWWMLE